MPVVEPIVEDVEGEIIGPGNIVEPPPSRTPPPPHPVAPLYGPMSTRRHRGLRPSMWVGLPNGPGVSFYPQGPMAPNWLQQPTLTRQMLEHDPSAALRNVINSAIPYLDAYTQARMAQWLAQQEHQTYGGYTNLPPPAPPGVEPGRSGYTPSIANQRIPGIAYVTQDRFLAMANLFDPTAVIARAFGTSASNVPNLIQNNQNLQQFAQAMNWLRSYLQIAAGGAPRMVGGRMALPTAAERLGALDALRTLEQQAQAAAAAGNYPMAAMIGVARMLVNPAMNRPPEWGGVGGARAVLQPGQNTPMRGGMLRNVALT